MAFADLLKIARSAAVIIGCTTLSSPSSPQQKVSTPASPNASVASSRRALLVGIAIYDQPPANRQPSGTVATSNELLPIAPPGLNRHFVNLRGPYADLTSIREVLETKYRFTSIKTLQDEEATRSAILGAIRSHLIDGASPGDICVFYYSGHGSRARNSKGGEPDGYDETIVPADANVGAADIRDKELARLFLQAIEKGITLTAIFDSCHSGSIGRGEGYPLAERVRTVDATETDVAELPAFRDPPEKLGALIVSAAQDYEAAQERPYQDTWRGNFTWALVSVLRQPSVSVNEPVDRVFQRVTAFMRGEGVTHQPVLAGNANRRKGRLFGQPADPTADNPAVAMTKVLDRVTVELQGGYAIGLSKGCELTIVSANPKERAVRLRVTVVRGLNNSEAMVIDGATGGLKQGDLFLVDRWATPEGADLRVWIPPALSETEIGQIAREAAALRTSGQVDWIEDPTGRAPDYIVQFEQDNWKRLSATGPADSLGRILDFKKLTAGLTQRPQLFFNIPPSRELAQALGLGSGSKRSAIEIAKSPANANYILAGRLNGATVEYAWVRPGASAEVAGKETNSLPARTDWIAASSNPATLASRLENLAVTLCRIRAWLQIQGGANSTFPYSLALRESGKQKIIREGEVREGLKYDLVLIADEEALRRLDDQSQYVRQRKLYVFAIDSHGSSYLLFNRAGDVENKFPVIRDKPPTQQPKVILLGGEGMIEMKPPFGLDTYILITTDESIPDPYILEFEGAQARGEDPQLAKLLYAVGTGTRAGRTAVPLNWSIDRMYLRSVGK